MQPFPYAQPSRLPKPKRTNCLKPIVGCILGPMLSVGIIFGCLLACISTLSLQGPTPPLGKNFEPNPTEAALHEQSIVNALQSALASTNNSFTIQIEERALSSWINTEYKRLFETYDIPQPFLWEYSEPEFQVSFENEQILFYVENHLPLLTLNGLLTAQISPPNTELTTYLVDVDIVKIESMGLAIEDDSATISAWITEIISDQIEDYRTSLGIENLEITEVIAQDGILTLRGQIQ